MRLGDVNQPSEEKTIFHPSFDIDQLLDFGTGEATGPGLNLET